MQKLLKQRDPSYTLRNCRSICNVALAGTYVSTTAASMLLLVSLVTQGRGRTIVLLGVCAALFIYIGIAHALIRAGKFKTAAYMLLLFYGGLATGIIWTWGINTPIAELLFGLVIVFAGILLTARHALYTAAIVSFILASLQTIILLGWHTPNTAWSADASHFGDVVAYSALFGMLALASWLYNREMEDSLWQARKAEHALRRQKETLEVTVQKRTKQLRESQLEELQQMYRVAELGQVGISLLHDLANNLTALSLEIEDLETKKTKKDITHARQIMHYLGDIVDSTRSRVHGPARKRTFNIIQKTNETMAFMRYTATKANVDIDWQPPAKSWQFKADPVSYGQVLTLLTNNAIDAYENTKPDVERLVRVAMHRNDDHITITISSNRGIPKHVHKHLFKPFNSNKKTGMGLGLYIAKQTVEGQLGGTIHLATRPAFTEFSIKLPLGT